MAPVKKLYMIIIIVVIIVFIAKLPLHFLNTRTGQELMTKIKSSGNRDPQTKLRNELNIKSTSPNNIQSSTKISSVQEDMFSYKKELPKNTIDLSNEITVLTAYFNIGKFTKGRVGHSHTPEDYYRWMSVYGYMANKLVLYTNDNTTYQYFQKLRNNRTEQTKLFLIERKELWSFTVEKNISDIFKQPGYPRHHPNTVVPAYSCAMHAKFELLNRVIRKNYFHTKYFMWLDIGIFRNPVKTTFRMVTPKGFDDTKVACSHISNINENVTYKDIIYRNMVWIANGCNVGKYDVLYKFTQEYMNFLDKSLSMKLMSTAQQILYGMYVDKDKPETKIQLYKSGWYKLRDACFSTEKN